MGTDPSDTAHTPKWQAYTRTGDDGETMLGDYTRVDKTDPRIIAYGDCEELAAFIGYTVNAGTELSGEMVRVLTRAQNDVIDVAADISAPIDSDDEGYVRIGAGYIERLEAACDHFGEELRTPQSFIVPGGTTTAALLHYTYSVARRAERSVVYVCNNDMDRVNVLTRVYLNRLANLLLVLARVANLPHGGDIAWEPRFTTRLGDTPMWQALPGEYVED